MAEGKNDFSIEEAYRKTIGELTESGKKIAGAPYLVLKDKIGNKYLIARMNQQDCVQGW